MTNAKTSATVLPPSHRLAYILIFVTPMLWCVNYLVARWAPGHVPPHTLAFGRWLVAASLLACFAGPELWRNRAFLRTHALRYLLLGALGMWICGAWVYIAGRTTTATNISLIYAASPVLITLLSIVWLHERFSRLQALGVAIALTGVVHVVIKGQWGALAAVQWVAGDLWIVAATTSWAGFAVLQRRWPTPLGGAAQLCAVSVGGLVVLLPFMLWELAQPGQGSLSGYAIWLMVLAGVCPGAGAYWCYMYVQRQLGVSRASAQLYLGPLYGATMAWLVLGEPVGWHHAVGAALILPGIWLVSQRLPDKAPAATADQLAEERGAS
jgi:drug/metabolite transporter (DMT)-like permease